MEAGGARQQTSTQTLTPKARRRHISCQLGHLFVLCCRYVDLQFFAKSAHSWAL